MDKGSHNRSCFFFCSKREGIVPRVHSNRRHWYVGATFQGCNRSVSQSYCRDYKYQVVQKVTQAFDQVSKEIKSKNLALKRGRLLLLKNKENLKDWQKKLDQYFDDSPDLAHAYYLKELFRDVYESDSYSQAKERLSI